MSINIKEIFLKLTSKTYPHGTESDLMHLLPELETDEFGNKFIQIGEKTSCMFTSHLDTATSANTDVTHVIEGNIIKTDGTSILGADDKAGVTIMLNMIENKIPGLYYFFLGEEVGCVGSKKVSAKQAVTKLENISKVISFDRRGYDNIITFQASSRCCSDEFGSALAKELNRNEISFSYKTDPTGIYTDSAQFTRIYPECTNISVGYRSEHTFAEQQDITHLELLANACLGVDWENLPVKRDPSKCEYSYSGYSSSGYRSGSEYGRLGRYYGEEYDEYDYYYSSSIRKNNIPSNYSAPDDVIHFMDPDYNHVSSVNRKKYSHVLTGVNFASERLDDEKSLIMNFLDSLEVECDTYEWDGFKLVVNHTKESGGHTTECSRDELADFLPSLDFWKKEILTYKDDSINVDKVF